MRLIQVFNNVVLLSPWLAGRHLHRQAGHWLLQCSASRRKNNAPATNNACHNMETVH
jgi:hypothetical protein